jgi:hypothetical protein
MALSGRCWYKPSVLSTEHYRGSNNEGQMREMHLPFVFLS